jgi:adenylosuccinate synthase
MNINNAAVIGLQFGDEGKGKIVDLLARDYDVVARFQGGDNAGHTIVVDGVKYKLSLIPSGVLHGKKVFLGNGVVVNPYKLKSEIEILRKQGIDCSKFLYIAENAFVIFSLHKAMDELNEKIRNHDAIGTTKNGIGFCYSQKIQRNGLRICDLYECEEILEAKISYMIESHNCMAKKHGVEEFSSEKMMREIQDFKEILSPFKVNEYDFIQRAIKNNEKVLFEGAQGCGLDINQGTYPFVTSSSTYVAQVSLGTSVSPKQIGKVYGILKAYTTRVGNGFFGTENTTEENLKDKMQEIGQEIGTVTGRKRRCGWLDLVMTKQFVNSNGVDLIVLTKIDVLDDFEKIKICIGYKFKGQEISHVPCIDYEDVEPIYKEFDGWKFQGKTENVINYQNLPENAKIYINYIENFLNTKVEIISTGPGREQTMIRNS